MAIVCLVRLLKTLLKKNIYSYLCLCTKGRGQCATQSQTRVPALPNLQLERLVW